jgi:hypothetical protein
VTPKKSSVVHSVLSGLGCEERVQPESGIAHMPSTDGCSRENLPRKWPLFRLRMCMICISDNTIDLSGWQDHTQWQYEAGSGQAWRLYRLFAMIFWIRENHTLQSESNRLRKPLLGL